MRRFVLECQACRPPRFRTSPLAVGGSDDGVPGINAASRQLAEHHSVAGTSHASRTTSYEAHGQASAVGFQSVEMPEEVSAQ